MSHKSEIDSASVNLYKKMDSLDDYSEYSGFQPEEGYVSNEKVAVGIAECVLFDIYGEENISEQRPYKIYLKDQSVWCIEGNLSPNTTGGVFYIEIKKEDGTIVKVVHTK